MTSHKKLPTISLHTHTHTYITRAARFNTIQVILTPEAGDKTDHHCRVKPPDRGQADSPRSGCRYRVGTCVRCEPLGPRTRPAPLRTLSGCAGTVMRTGAVVPSLRCAQRWVGKGLAGPLVPGPVLPP